ncbi:MAG: RNA-guided endonuclease InsQ/TnpB family protein, partial [Acidimicrobiales bacterium]
MSVRSAKYLLQPTRGQSSRLDRLLWQQRLLYNRALEERNRAWEQEHRSLSRFEQFASLNGMAVREPELGRYGTCVARGTLTRLDLAYRAFYRRCRQGQTPGHPRFKSRWRFDSASYPDTSGWRLDTDSRRVALLGVGQVKVKLHRRLPGRPKTATVKREGRRWLLIVVCYQVPAAPLPATW